MGTKTESKTIGDHEFTVKQWNATKAMIMKIKIMKYLGKFLTAVGTEGLVDIQYSLMNNLGNILDSVNEDEFVALIKDIACSASRDNERMSLARFDEYFNEDIMEAYQLAFFVIKVNYQDFLASVLSLQTGLFG